MAKYSSSEVLEITNIQLMMVNDSLPLEAACRRVLEIAPSFPVHNLNSYTSRMRKYLSGVGEYGYAYPANWAQALIEATGENKLVIDAFKQQQQLYLEKEGRSNQKLAAILEQYS